MRSFQQLLDVDPGFKTANIGLTCACRCAGALSGRSRRMPVFERLFDRVDALPGVEAAGATSTLPLIGLGSATSFMVVDQPETAGQEPVADVRVITHGYFEVIGNPLIKGRLFNEHDAADATTGSSSTSWRGSTGRAGPIGKKIRFVERRPGGRDHRHCRRRKQAGLDAQARPTTYWRYARMSTPR